MASLCVCVCVCMCVCVCVCVCVCMHVALKMSAVCLSLPACLCISFSGTYTVNVSLAGRPIKGSPFRVKTYDPSKVKVSKISQGIVGVPNKFTGMFVVVFDLIIRGCFAGSGCMYMISLNCLFI